MSEIPQARFLELLQDIEPSATTNKNASEAHTELRDFLKADPEFSKYHSSDFLSGSYKRDTAIRPRKKGDQVDRPDVDIIVITNHTTDADPKEVVNLLFRTLKKKYPNIRRQNRSVGIEYYKADMDVVPAIPNGSRLLIPDRDSNTWVTTDPEKHTSWTADINQRTEGRFKPLVKLIKWYRRQHPTNSKKPKGLTLECMVAECMDYQETDYGELFVKTLENMVRRYDAIVSIGFVPTIQDPAIPGNSVTDDIKYEDFREFFHKIKDHAKVGRDALNCTDCDEATGLFREVLGDRFPKTTSNRAKSTLAEPVVATSATFPNRPIRPNKPTGFANVVSG
ncbi:hypothetical protein X792_01225 [Dehalococcoides mccartyi CG1]|jgi:hypothetical protein|uniref:SMODS domain-containing nucleotidyltransferase n=1 Tax=Dehalococcoides mccartyi TaxID=61435 RepID=UPI0004E06FF4|nr:nucleotidyltransferase [Dehalococcoides mccartyi]AII57428.1 hypothetical protein X792_01225 [Dehalococcoides mccartyi CG1]